MAPSSRPARLGTSGKSWHAAAAAVAVCLATVIPAGIALATTVPPNNGSVAVSATITVTGTFDGGMKRYYGTGALGTSGQSESQEPIFELSNGATIKNTILGNPAADGVHCLGSCNIQNVWWEDVGEDAATFLPTSTSQTMNISGGGALHAADKVIQHNGPGGTVVIDGFQVEDFGKLYRSCGNCSTQGKRSVIIRNVTATYKGSAIAGINQNYGDTATFSNITIIGDSNKSIDICQRYIGNNTGAEPTKTGSGPDGIYCKYSDSDIHYSSGPTPTPIVTPTPVPTPTPTPVGTATPTPNPSGTVSINAGGSATGSFSADQYYSGGSTYTNTATIDESQITSNVPPAAIFNTERYGAMTYTIPNRTAGSAQTVTLYFSENYVTAAGQRVFNVSINGSSVLSNFDIYASAGGQNRAIARTFSTTANSSGQVVIGFTAVTENPKISGITVASGSSPSPTPVPTPTPVRTASPTPSATATPGVSSISINAGGSASGSFSADQYYSGGTTYTNTATIDESQITSNVPPAAIFNTERYGAMTYTIPNLTAGRAYTVTLYFAETYLTAAGQRLFSVSINGTSVLSSFDIYASAGGANRAIARTFSTTANSSGQVVIAFTAVTENPKINGFTVAG